MSLEFTFTYAPRSCNKVAHECARQVLSEQILGE
jgi:hypothetical protein